MPYIIENGKEIKLELISSRPDLFPKPLYIRKLSKILDVNRYPNRDGELNILVHSAKMEEPSIHFEYTYGFEDLFRKKQAVLYRYPMHFYLDDKQNPIYVFELAVYNNGNNNASDFFTTKMIETPEKLLDLVIKVTSDSIENEVLPL